MDWDFFRQASWPLASLAAVAAGLISFFSPCILPLVPSFLGYVTGTVVQPGTTVRRWHTFLHALAFVLGFSLIFVLLMSRLEWAIGPLYAEVSWLNGRPAEVLSWPGNPPLTYLDLVQKIGGLFLILFGLHTMGLLRIGFLDTEKRLNVQVSRRWGYLSSLLVGIVFALGWSPCIAAPLAGILLLGTETPGMMFWLLSLYALGLGVPFLLFGLFLDRVTPVIRWMTAHRRPIAIVSGALIIILGLAVFFGQLALLSRLPAWF